MVTLKENKYEEEEGMMGENEGGMEFQEEAGWVTVEEEVEMVVDSYRTEER